MSRHSKHLLLFYSCVSAVFHQRFCVLAMDAEGYGWFKFRTSSLKSSLKFRSLYQHNRFDGLLFQMQEFLSFFILHKIGKVVVRFKFHEMNLIRLFYVAFYITICTWPHPKQKPAIVFRNRRNRDRLKLIENILLSI